jgi:hypothetical protein
MWTAIAIAIFIGPFLSLFTLAFRFPRWWLWLFAIWLGATLLAFWLAPKIFPCRDADLGGGDADPACIVRGVALIAMAASALAGLLSGALVRWVWFIWRIRRHT